MSFVIAILVIIILSLNASYIFQKKFEYMLPLTTAAVSLILYVFSFLGERSIGIYLILTTLIVSTIYLIYKIIHEHGRIIDIFKSSGFISFLLITLFICIIIRGFVFSTWDEFSHWGLILKNMFLTNDFGNLSNSTTLFKWYPPGISLFLNFTTYFSKFFSESSALGGILALSYAQLIIIFAKVKYNDWKKIILITGIILIAPLVFFNSFYSTIYVDAIMALIFANILYFNYSYHKRDVFWVIYMSLQFYLLVNTKQIGIIFALIAFATIIVSFIISSRLKSIKLFLSKKKNNLICIFIPLATGLATYLSWKLYIKSHNIVENFSINLSSNFLNLFRPDSPYYHKLTIVNFIHNFFEVRQYGTMFFSFFLWSVILALIMYCVHRIISKHKQKSFLFQISTILGLYLYSGIILLLYLIAFDEYESTTLASVERYLGSYFLGLLILVIFISIDYFIRLRKYHLSPGIKIASLLVVLLCVIPINNLINDTVLQSTSNTKKQQIRAPYERVNQYKNLLNPAKDRLYIISQNTKGFDYYVLIYNFTPIQTQVWSRAWSLGKPYSPDDQWTADITASEWSKTLVDFTYVYLYNVDDRFISDYGQLFEKTTDIKNTSMYRVDKTNGGIILRSIAPTPQ